MGQPLKQTRRNRKGSRQPGRNVPVDIEGLVGAALETLKRDSMIRLTALGPPRARPAVVERLKEAGYEVTRSVVRRALVEQLRAALADGAFIPLKSVATFVSGATAKEAKLVATRLVAAGEAHLVRRTKIDTLVPASAPVVTRAQLAALQSALATLQKQVAPLTRSAAKATLLRDDVIRLLEPALDQLQEPSAKSPLGGAKRASRLAVERNSGFGSAPRENAPRENAPRENAPRENAPRENAPREHGTNGLERLWGVLDAVQDERLGLSFIPKVMQELSPQLEPKAAQSVLLAAAKAGLVELRPEGGLGRLSEAELELCPTGPGGTRLSWARRVVEEG